MMSNTAMNIIGPAMVVAIAGAITYGVICASHASAPIVTDRSITVNAPGWTERAIVPTVFLECRAGHTAEVIPAGGSLVVHCVSVGGDR